MTLHQSNSLVLWSQAGSRTGRHEGPIWIMTETKEKKKRKQPNVVSSLNTDKLH
jgi:hypothetical protein